MMFPSQFPNKNGRSEESYVTLTDEQGRSLDCIIQSSIELEGQDYLLVLPVDSPVEILTWPDEDDDESAVPVESDAELDSIFPTAKVVLEEQNLTLKRTAVTLTVSGELPDFPDEEELNNVDLDSSEPEEREYEELLWLASFYHQEQEYGIYTPADPFFILARVNDQGEPQLLSPEEFKKLEPLLPLIEDQLFDDLE